MHTEDGPLPDSMGFSSLLQGCVLAEGAQGWAKSGKDPGLISGSLATFWLCDLTSHGL